MAVVEPSLKMKFVETDFHVGLYKSCRKHVY